MVTRRLANVAGVILEADMDISPGPVLSDGGEAEGPSDIINAVNSVRLNNTSGQPVRLAIRTTTGQEAVSNIAAGVDQTVQVASPLKAITRIFSIEVRR